MEKQPICDVEKSQHLDIEQSAEPAKDRVTSDERAHILDASRSQVQPESGEISLALDGKTILIPQPSDDPNDPLNWSPKKKGITLTVISIVSFMPDFGSSMGIVTLLPQAR